jgi:hypothetical protein
MEWWKLFGGAFILIFLAELGDKTQLAALAKTAESPDDPLAKWAVFLGASLALVASTFIAVFAGSALKALVPDERFIRVAAGGLFLVFGTLILNDAWHSFRTAGSLAAAPEPAETAGAAFPGAIGPAAGLVLRAARSFESASGERYRRLARSAAPGLASLLEYLAREEDSHLTRLARLDARDCDINPDAGPGSPLSALFPGGAGTDALAQLIRHEEATAQFYQALASRARLPSLKAVFSTLAEEERAHARRLAQAIG